MASTHAPDEINFHFEQLNRLKKNFTINTVIAPRHIKRSKEIFEFFKSQHISSNLLSEINSTEKSSWEKNILIIDTFGDLAKFIQMQKYIYVGGGYSDRGVQNIIEPSVLVSQLSWDQTLIIFMKK